jgi:hypothetical protein
MDAPSGAVGVPRNREVIAEAIHKCSARANGPVVKANCAAIPSGLRESKLFGHERGAYIGAFTKDRHFEQEVSGRLFREIAATPPYWSHLPFNTCAKLAGAVAAGCADITERGAVHIQVHGAKVMPIKNIDELQA